MITEKFIKDVEQHLNVTNVALLPELERVQEFVIGVMFAKFPKTHLFYKKSLTEFLTTILSPEILSMQAFNSELLNKDVYLFNQIFVRLSVMGWFFGRGFGDKEDVEYLETFCTMFIDFGLVDIKCKSYIE